MTQNSSINTSQDKQLFILEHNEQAIRAALFSGERLVQYFQQTPEKRSLVGNIYLGKVRRVVPKMQAVFVDIGLKETALLSARDIQTKVQKNLQDVLTGFFEGQKVWVQVCKDALTTKAGLNNKGARVTTELSLETNNLVFLPDSSKITVSKKITDSRQRQILKSGLKYFVDSNEIVGGFIIRTTVNEAKDDGWLQDAAKLWEQWRQIQQAQLKATKVGLVYQSSGLVGDLVNIAKQENIQSVQGVEHVERYFDGANINYVASSDEEIQKQLKTLKFENQLNMALAAVVEIPTGGSITFDTTEALTVIDVNMGSAVNTGGNAYEVNINAAELIAQQLLLRKISGIVIIDFIRLPNKKERNRIVELMQNLFINDFVETNIYGFTRLGLFEISRERVALSLRELLLDDKEC